MVKSILFVFGFVVQALISNAQSPLSATPTMTDEEFDMFKHIDTSKHHPDVFWMHALMDGDGDGGVSATELYQYFIAIGAADIYGDGHMSLDIPIPPESLLRTEQILGLVDTNVDRVISIDELHQLANRAGTLAGDNYTNVPQQLHLALTPNSDEMHITFAIVNTSKNNSGGSYVPQGHILMGDGRIFAAVRSTYIVPPRWWQKHGWKGWLYKAVITGLTPGESYTYTAVTDVNTSSPAFTFKAAPKFTSEEIVSFATFGDMGTYIPLGFKVTEKLIEDQQGKTQRPVDFIMHQGDISYAGVDSGVPILNISSSDEYEAVWDLFGRQMEPLSARMPYMVGVGNHEAWYNFSAYRARYTMPLAENSNGNLWYSYQYGSVHITSADSETDYTAGSPQLTWIAADLAAARANPTVKWIILTVHRPLLCSSTSEYDSHKPGSLMISSMQPLMLEFGVDLTLTGHIHEYERIHPNINGTVVSRPTVVNNALVYSHPTTPVHLMIATSGAFQDDKWVSPTPDWSARRIGPAPVTEYMHSFGYGRVDVFNSSHLRFQFVPVTGNMTDEFWIQK